MLWFSVSASRPTTQCHQPVNARAMSQNMGTLANNDVMRESMNPLCRWLKFFESIYIYGAVDT
jgi:hypothetical protein